jgi:hypothetical protein
MAHVVLWARFNLLPRDIVSIIAEYAIADNKDALLMMMEKPGVSCMIYDPTLGLIFIETTKSSFHVILCIYRQYSFDVDIIHDFIEHGHPRISECLSQSISAIHQARHKLQQKIIEFKCQMLSA